MTSYANFLSLLLATFGMNKDWPQLSESCSKFFVTFLLITTNTALYTRLSHGLSNAPLTKGEKEKKKKKVFSREALKSSSFCFSVHGEYSESVQKVLIKMSFCVEEEL